MKPEDERSLTKRPDNLPENLTRGGLIVGTDQTIRGSLMALSGLAIERITRERAELPPGQRLPENAVYFMDPDAKRLIMVSRRENYPTGRGSCPDWENGLFAETVELDDEGEPRFSLSTKEVTLPKNQYQMVAVGPNRYKMPPSHIDMMEEETPGKEKFVPWNIYLANLQSWMNEVSIGPNETFESFMKNFDELRSESQKAVKTKIKTAFVGGSQGFDETVAPFNLIITDEVNKEKYEKASRDAGLFPVYVSARDFILISENLPESDGDLNKIRRSSGDYGDWRYSMGHFLPVDWG